MTSDDMYTEIIDKVLNKQLSKQEVSVLKHKFSKKHGSAKIPTDFEILLRAEAVDLPRLKCLTSKPTRTSSGVAVVAIMTKPSRCPHGKCSYCPGGPGSEFGDVPQSYTGQEPASMRGARNKYDPYLQIFNRLEQYTVLGHNYDKIELIVMGGTFPALDKRYREHYIANSFKAMNDFGKLFYRGNKLRFREFKAFFELPGEIGNKRRVKRIQSKTFELRKNAHLEQEKKKNESSKIRCVALCIETRPDYCKIKHINDMLKYGATRVELGVQSLNERALRKVDRGHSVQESISATKFLKDSFLKVGYHMMPGLPGTTISEDLKMLKELFANSDLKPDALKIYPCMVMPGTRLYDKYKRGGYTPLTTKKAVQLIAKFKAQVPRYCRIMRVQRDIPTKVTAAGVDMTNLRQEVRRVMQEKGLKCDCIRCREPRNEKIEFRKIKIITEEYEASGGTEVFISADDVKNDLIAGFCRLRIPDKPFREEITKKSAGIRELHVYGALAPIGKEGKVQHRGLGKRLLQRAERIAKERFDKHKIVVISGIGVRQYYRKQGYKKQGAYMVKQV